MSTLFFFSWGFSSLLFRIFLIFLNPILLLIPPEIILFLGTINFLFFFLLSILSLCIFLKCCELSMFKVMPLSFELLLFITFAFVFILLEIFDKELNDFFCIFGIIDFILLLILISSSFKLLFSITSFLNLLIFIFFSLFISLISFKAITTQVTLSKLFLAILAFKIKSTKIPHFSLISLPISSFEKIVHPESNISSLLNWS